MMDFCYIVLAAIVFATVAMFAAMVLIERLLGRYLLHYRGLWKRRIGRGLWCLRVGLCLVALGFCTYAAPNLAAKLVFAPVSQTAREEMTDVGRAGGMLYAKIVEGLASLSALQEGRNVQRDGLDDLVADVVSIVYGIIGGFTVIVFAAGVVYLISFLVCIAVLFVWLNIGAVARLHDMNCRGWWILLIPVLVVLFQSLWLLLLYPMAIFALGMIPGTQGDNRFGRTTKTISSEAKIGL